MAVTLRDPVRAVRGVASGARGEDGLVRPAAHGSTLLRHARLLLEEGDHRVGRPGVEFGAVRALQGEDAPSVLDHRALEPEADPKEGDPPFAHVAHGLDLSLDPAVPEASGDEEPLHVLKVPLRTLGGDLLSGDPHEVDPCV